MVSRTQARGSNYPQTFVDYKKTATFVQSFGMPAD